MGTQDDKDKQNTDRQPFWGSLTKRNKILFVIAILVLVGISLTYLPTGVQGAKVVASSAMDLATETISEVANNTNSTSVINLSYEEELERKLEAILKELAGAGATKVMVTTSTSDEMILAEEVVESFQQTDETDKSGGVKSNTKQDTTRKVVMEKGDTPIVLSTNKPQLEGVLVLAEGANNSQVKAAIIKAVSSVLD